MERETVLTTTYPFPWDVFFSLAADLPRGKRSLLADAQEMVRRVSPPPAAEEEQNIPPKGPLLVAANHFQRRGLWIAWPSAVITVAIGRRRFGDPPIHWLATGGIRLFQARNRGPEIPLTRLIFRRVAHVYGISALPVNDSRERALALRRWVRWIDRGEVVGIYPEGLSGRSDGLRVPEPGFDRLLRLAVRRGARVLPVAICELHETLTVRFGTPLDCPQHGYEVMRAIAALLPPGQRGVYGSTEEG